jgi:hypothetical protein
VKPVASLIWLRAQHSALDGVPSPGYSMQPVTRPERRYPPFEWFLPRCVIHAAVHLHMFLAGCLLNWAVIGIDPIRRRPGTRGKLAALFIEAAGHDTLAKLMYAWMLPAGGGPAPDASWGPS